MPKPTKARENPFRSERVAEFRYRIDPERLAGWRRTIRESRTSRLAIVGPEGTGKTVLLEDLAAGFGAADWIRIHLDDPLARRIALARKLYGSDPKPLFVDGLEALPPWLTGCPARLLRPRVVATLHRPRRAFGVLFETSFDAGAVLAMIEYLKGAPVPPAGRGRILRLAGEHGGNVREVLRQLYREESEGATAFRTDT
ncbi:MAG: hypothetical protein ACLFSZ_00665 [Puniceicoccaceae bacterium]